MANPVKTFFLKLARKCVMAGVVGLLALAAFSLWLFTQEPAGFEARRARLLVSTQQEISELRGEQAQISREQDESAAALTFQKSRFSQAEKALRSLHQLDPSWFERIAGDAANQQEHAARIARVAEVRSTAGPRIVELQRKLVLTARRQSQVSERLAQVEQENLALTADHQAIFHYLRIAWQEYRWWVGAVVVVYLLGRLLVSLIFYYGCASWVARGKAVQLVQAEVALPVVQESALSVEDALWPGEVLRVRPQFLQSYEDGLSRRGCLVLNWRRACSCLASGLTSLVELRNARNAGERRVTFACSNDPFAELSIVSVPDSGAFILRAGFLMGVITAGDKPVTIRRHLRLFNWQSWVSGRFGYWEFAGPCRLIVSCVSPVAAEVLTAGEEGNLPSRRAAQAGVVGFSPQLALKPVRCVGFWRYYREHRPLYEVEISGSGVFLASEAGGRARQRMRGNEGPAVKLLKLLGL